MQALADGPTILQQHAIAFDRSAELREQTQNVTAAADGGGGAAAAGAALPAVDCAGGDAAVQGLTFSGGTSAEYQHGSLC